MSNVLLSVPNGERGGWFRNFVMRRMQNPPAHREKIWPKDPQYTLNGSPNFVPVGPEFEFDSLELNE